MFYSFIDFFGKSIPSHCLVMDVTFLSSRWVVAALSALSALSSLYGGHRACVHPTGDRPRLWETFLLHHISSFPLRRHFFHCSLCHSHPRGLGGLTKKRFSATYFATILAMAFLFLENKWKVRFFSLQNPSSDIRSGRPKPLRWLQKRFSATYFATILANAFLFSVFREKRFPFFKPRFLILEVVAPKNPQAETVNLDLLISFFSNGKLGRLVFHGNFVSFVAELLTRSTLNCSEEEEAAIIFKLGFVWDNRK